MHESTFKRFATSLDLSHFKGFYCLSLCSRILLWPYILCLFLIGHINIHLSLMKLQYVYILSKAKKWKDPWSSKSLFPTLVGWPIVVLWWRFHQTPPMGHGRMGIGKEPCGLNIMPFFGYTLKRGHKLCVHKKDLSTSKLMKSLIQKRFDELTKCLLIRHI